MTKSERVVRRGCLRQSTRSHRHPRMSSMKLGMDGWEGRVMSLHDVLLKVRFGPDRGNVLSWSDHWRAIRPSLILFCASMYWFAFSAIPEPGNSILFGICVGWMLNGWLRRRREQTLRRTSAEADGPAASDGESIIKPPQSEQS